MSNLYRIGVNIAMTSNGPQMLQRLSHHILGVHANVNQLTGGMNRLKLAIGGAFAIAGGVALVGMFKGPLEEARKLEMAVGRFSRFGLGPERTKEATEFAKAMNVAGATYVDNMNRMIEAQGIFRESGLSGSAALAGAKLAAPVMSRMAFADSALDSETKAGRHHQYAAMVRFIEMAGGLSSPEKFNSLANQGYKAIVSSGGNVNWEQYRQFMATAGVAGRNIAPETLFGMMEPIIGELKGSRAGTAYQTAYSSFTGILKPTSQRAAEAMKLGLWDKNSVRMTPEGAKLISGVNPIVDRQLFDKSQPQYYEKYVRPAYDRAGYDQGQRDRSNILLFGRTGGGMYSLYDRQSALMHHSVDSQRKAMGIDQAYSAAGGTLNGKIVDLQARYVNLMERLGEAVLPLAVKGLEVLIPAITKLTDWVGKHPGEVRVFAKSIVVIAGALVGLGVAAVAVAGGLAIMAGGWVAAVVVGIGALAGGIGTLVALNWGAVKTAAAALWGFVADVYKIVSFVVANPLRAAGGFFGPVGMRDITAAERAKSPGASDRIFDFAPKGMSGLRDAMAPNRRGGVPPPSAANSNAAGGGNVFLDGKKVGAIIGDRMGQSLGYQYAGSRPDSGAAMAWKGAPYNR